MITLVKWIFVHLIVDFLFQSTALVAQKRRLKARSWFLYIHCLLQGALVYLVAPSWNLWQVGVIVAVSHFVIDLWKIYQKNNIIYFVLDQLFHLLVLFVLWGVFIEKSNWYSKTWGLLNNNMDAWLVATGYLVVTFPLSHLMYHATQRWRASAEPGFGLGANSLSEAGKWIGIFERILVYTFVITGEAAGIGFLIAAKSVLRFNDIKGSEARKETEYVLIGTLMSFAFSILTGLLVRIGLSSI